MCAASANSVRALSHFEKWLRAEWYAMLSPGTTRMCSSSDLRSFARPTSPRSGVLKTKSPKPNCSTMKLRRSWRASGESFNKNDAPAASARAAFAVTLDCSMTGTSGCACRTRRANSTPASAVITPPTGNSMSEITPSTFSRYVEKQAHASSNVRHRRIFGRAWMRMRRCDAFTPSGASRSEWCINSV